MLIDLCRRTDDIPRRTEAPGATGQAHALARRQGRPGRRTWSRRSRRLPTSRVPSACCAPGSASSPAIRSPTYASRLCSRRPASAKSCAPRTTRWPSWPWAKTRPASTCCAQRASRSTSRTSTAPGTAWCRAWWRPATRAAEALLKEVAAKGARAEALSELYVGLAQRDEAAGAGHQRWLDAARTYETMVGAHDKALEAVLRAFAKDPGSRELLAEAERLDRAGPRLAAPRPGVRRAGAARRDRRGAHRGARAPRCAARAQRGRCGGGPRAPYARLPAGSRT